MSLYSGSDGEFYTEYEVGRKFETGAWKPCMWDSEEGWELVETPEEQLLWLVPVTESDLPTGVDVERTDRGPRLQDDRDDRP